MTQGLKIVMFSNYGNKKKKREKENKKQEKIVTYGTLPVHKGVGEVPPSHYLEDKELEVFAGQH